MAKQFKSTIAPPALSTDPTGTYAGEIYYNTVLGSLKIFNGTTWSTLTGGSSASSESLEVLENAPSSPSQGRIYFDSSENTIKVYNGYIWYDVAGPKNILDHTHSDISKFVDFVQYDGYVVDNLVVMDGGTASTDYTSTPNNDIIDGGGA